MLAGALSSWRLAYGVLGAAASIFAALGAALTLGRDGWLRTPVLLLLAATALSTPLWDVASHG